MISWEKQVPVQTREGTKQRREMESAARAQDCIDGSIYTMSWELEKVTSN